LPGKAIHLSIESSILVSFHIFNFFLRWTNQIGSLQKKKLDLWTCIGTVHIAEAVIGWRHSGKEMRGQTQFSTKFAANLSFMAGWSPVTFFFPFFEISPPMWPNRGVPVPSFPDFRDNFILLLNSQPLFPIIFVIPTRYHPQKMTNFLSC
jgi:hypothetical protein